MKRKITTYMYELNALSELVKFHCNSKIIIGGKEKCVKNIRRMNNDVIAYPCILI